MPAESRRETRIPAYAKVLFLEGRIPGYLRDVSPNGCRIALLEPARIGWPGALLSVRLLPPEESGIPPFEARLQVCWLLGDSVYRTLGGILHVPESGEAGGGEARVRLEGLYGYYARQAGAGCHQCS